MARRDFLHDGDLDAAALEDTLQRVFDLGPQHFAPMMTRARAWFVENKSGFTGRIEAALLALDQT